MKLFVTGSGGFLGRAVVAAALDAGHDIRALVRDATRWTGPEPGPHLELVTGDLRATGPWTNAIEGVDVVIHLAAAKSGDLHAQFAGTVVGTERLLDALTEAPPSRLVHISTFSVYDYDTLSSGAVLDEGASLEARPQSRDEYAQTKLVQESLVRRFAASTTTEVVILRPGAVWGPGALWDGGAIMGLGSRHALAVAPDAPLKLTYVSNCADAIVAACAAPAAVGATVNIVDTDLPSARVFASKLRAAGLAVRRPIPLPYAVAHAVAIITEVVNLRCFGGRVKLPGVIMPSKLAARVKPLRYPNTAARDTLGWSPALGLDDAIAACARAEREHGR